MTRLLTYTFATLLFTTAGLLVGDICAYLGTGAKLAGLLTGAAFAGVLVVWDVVEVCDG